MADYENAETCHEASVQRLMIFGLDGEKLPQFPYFKSPKLYKLFRDVLQPTPIKRLLDLTAQGHVFRSQYDPTPPKRQRAKS
jgi:hypothetical protein